MDRILEIHPPMCRKRENALDRYHPIAPLSMPSDCDDGSRLLLRALDKYQDHVF